MNVDESEQFRRKLHQEYLQDPRSDAELVKIVLSATNEALKDEAIVVLWHRAPHELLNLGQSLSGSKDPQERQLGARLLGQPAGLNRIPVDQALAILLPMLVRESNSDVILAICLALRNLADPRAIEPLLKLKNNNNPDVRFAVVQGLLPLREEGAIVALIELSNDDNTDVRDWATYALAQAKEIDSSAVRDALWTRISDPDPDTRGEAMVGLAIRGDARVIDPLVHELESVRNNAGRILVEAAVEAVQRLDDPRLCEAVKRLCSLPDQFGYEEDLSEALARCTA